MLSKFIATSPNVVELRSSELEARSTCNPGNRATSQCQTLAELIGRIRTPPRGSPAETPSERLVRTRAWASASPAT
eukprot:11166727-Lingulodinium_polyedra.AAC.1